MVRETYRLPKNENKAALNDCLMPLERDEQIMLVTWLKMHPILKLSIIKLDNEGKRAPYVGKLLKRMGLRPGASDLFIAYPTKAYHGLFIEMKRRKGGVVSDSQEKFLDDMRQLGYAAHVCSGFDEAKKCVETYLTEG